MAKFFNVKVNGVAYDVEVEEVLAKVPPKQAEKVHNVVEEKVPAMQVNAPQVKVISNIEDEELVPVPAMAEMSEVNTAEDDFASHYNSVYNEMASNGNTAVLEPPVSTTFTANTVEMSPVTSWTKPSNYSNEPVFDFDSPKFSATPRKIGKNSVIAPLQGKIVALPIKEGTKVRTGDVLCVIDTNGVESEIMSPIDAEVVGVFVGKGSRVNLNDILFTLT